jgi:uncharacterized protein YcnI
MKKSIVSLLAGLLLSAGLASAQASVLDTATTFTASQTALYGVFHDRPTDFVFVKLPQGWIFAGRDEFQGHHDVFLDPSTGFVFVKLSSGWKFIGKVAD